MTASTTLEISQANFAGKRDFLCRVKPKRPFLYSMLEKKCAASKRAFTWDMVGVEACAAGEHPKNYSLSENSKEA